MVDQQQVQDAVRRAAERHREATDEISRTAGRMSSLGAETVGTWAELNQRVGQDLLRISSSTVEETARASTEMHQTLFGAWRDAQTSAFQWQMLWPEFFRDPVRWYQHAFEHGIGTMQQTFEVNRRTAEIALRSFERLQTHSQEAARTLDDTFRQGAAKIRDIQSRTETTRVA
jgi:hypothetical protein